MNKILKRIYFLVWVPLRSLVSLFFVGGSFVMLLGVLLYSLTFEWILKKDIFIALPEDIKEVVNWKPRSNSIILDRNGRIVSEQFSEYHVFVPYKEIPPKMIDIILAIEDRKFWRHKGIDVYSIIRAATGYLNPSHKGIRQGASTITQQVVKNLILSNEKTISRKVREIVLSLFLETKVSKEKILEIYCNNMFLGSGAYGIGAAAKRFFDKKINELSESEMALIAGLFQSPGKYNPMKYPGRAKKRQLVVLKAMRVTGIIDKKSFLEFKEKKIIYKKYEMMYGKYAPFFVDFIVEESNKILTEKNINLKDSGLKIYTTLDLNLEQLAEKSFLESEDIFKKLESSIVYDNKVKTKKSSAAEGAMLVLDRRTGSILSMLGGRDYTHSQFNRTINSRRAPGSVFKPIIYALGLERGHSWNKQYYVTPVTVGNYRPRTQRSRLFTETTMMHSFYKSINSTAILLGVDLGVKKVIRFAEKLGVRTPLKEEAATLLGGSEVTMLDMAKVYSVFANDGVLNKPYAIERIENMNGDVLYQSPARDKLSYRALESKTNQLIVEGLKSVINYGTGYKAKFLSGRAAGKTGTSNKSRDNWFCGFTDDLVIITWMGNDEQNSFRSNISASNTATALWASFANKSIKYLKTKRLLRPKDLIGRRVHSRFGHLDTAGVNMYFAPGKEPQKKVSDLFLLDQGKQLRVGMNEI